MIISSAVDRNRRRRTTLVGCGAALTLLALAGCTDNVPVDVSSSAAAGDGRTLAVQATDTSCAVSAASAPSGTLRFTVTNGGAKVTEFYLLGPDGLRIVGEVENIGPGLTRDLVLTAAPGGYFTSCKPGMVGDGLRAPFTVSDSGADLTPQGDDQQLVEQATANYAAYVKDQTEQLLARTETFVQLYEDGKDDQARALYADARLHWERIEPVAESFGDLDPRMDLREADLEEGDRWTGWHRIEKDLWPPASYTARTTAQRASYGDDLLADTKELYQRTRTITFTADQIANGSKALLDEVATGKVTGEEETWSHTDLWDFQGNVDGARVGFEDLRPLLHTRDPELETRIDEEFTALQALLDQHRSGDGFVLYTELSKGEIRELVNAVDALSEPLSQLTAAVV